MSQVACYYAFSSNGEAPHTTTTITLSSWVLNNWILLMILDATMHLGPKWALVN
jgi:hypothetical protein